MDEQQNTDELKAFAVSPGEHRLEILSAQIAELEDKLESLEQIIEHAIVPALAAIVVHGTDKAAEHEKVIGIFINAYRDLHQ